MDEHAARLALDRMDRGAGCGGFYRLGDAMTTLGDRIREGRKQKGLSQMKLGERLGVAGAAVGRWELNIHGPERQYIVNLAKALGLTVDFLLTGREAPAHAALIAAIRRGERQEVLMAMVDRHG